MTSFRTVILVIAPAVMLVGSGYHPWIGNPGDPEFFQRLAAAVAADTTRWWVAHLLVAVGSGLLVIAFLALRSYLRDAGEQRWSVMGLPFIVMGSTLYALLPAMEFAPVGAFRTGADIAAVQAALMPWIVPGALVVMAASRFFPVGAAQLYVGPVAGIVALWSLAYTIWKHPQA